jgi:hypothetical protein
MRRAAEIREVKKENGKIMTRSTARIIGASMLAMVVLLLCSLPLAAQDNNTYIQHANRFAVSPPLSELAKLPQHQQYGFHEANPVRRIPKRPIGPTVDPVEQRGVPPSANYTIGANILGVGHGFPNYSVPDAPPDTGNTLWIPLGGICAANNDGDIIAQWDVVAHRWLLTQNVFSGTFGVCVAISTSNDATGSYFLYEFPVVNNGFPDYPKWGAWVNDWAETWNNFGPGGGGFVGPVLCAYNRTKLLAGDHTAEQICHQYESIEDSLLPADRDSVTAPPTGQDQFAIGSVGDVDNTHLSLYSVHINDPSNWGAGATFTGDGNSQLLPIASFTPSCHGSFGGDCVPQKGITDLADSLGDRLMYRFAYWEDQPAANVKANPPKPAPAQHWFVNWDVEASGGNIGPRWMEITAPIKTITLPADLSKINVFQQGTYAPDGNWRWMGSVTRDKVGDILLGYSESCGSSCPGGTSGGVYPSIFIAGRQVNDPLGLGNLEAEVEVVAGSGSQPDTSDRWGDYSSMRIDTNDGMNGCTFWYTQEFYQVTQSFDWSTQINSAQFSNCN